MKRRNAFGSSLLYILVCLAFCVHPLESQVNALAAGAYKPPNLTGSKLKMEDIAAKADAVFVGQIVEMGDPTPSSPGVASYGVTVKVLQVLRGAVDAQITVTIDTFALNREGPPQVGSSYICFVRKNAPGQPDPYQMLKLIPVTEDNITKVKAVIADAPAGK